MSRSSVSFAGAVTAAMLLASLAGCSTHPAEGPDAPVSIRLYDQIRSLDPALSADGPGYQMSMFLYDRLIVLEGGEAVPYVAQSWKTSPTSVTFTIRDGITCEDGSALTARAIEASMKRALDPATKSPLAGSLLPAGTTFASDDDARTLTVTTTKPDTALVLSFANPVLSIVCPAGLKKPHELASKAFGSGPYVLDKAVTGTSYTVTKRDGYTWGPQPYAADADALPPVVTAKVLSNETTAANVFLQGDLDVTNAIGESTVKRLRTKGADESPIPNAFAFLLFNQASGLGRDPVVRRAVAEAVDPTAYAVALQGKLASPSANLLPPEVTVCAQTDGERYRPTFDSAAARRTLEADGWTLTSEGRFEKDGKPLRLRVGSHNQEGSAGAYLAQVLEDLGATVEADQVELPAYIETLQKGDWDVFAATIITLDSPAPLGQTLLGPDGLDLGSVRNARFEQAMAGASDAKTLDKSCDLWKDAQDRLVENVDVVPQAHTNLVYFDDGIDFDFGFAGLIEPTSMTRK